MKTKHSNLGVEITDDHKKLLAVGATVTKPDTLFSYKQMIAHSKARYNMNFSLGRVPELPVSTMTVCKPLQAVDLDVTGVFTKYVSRNTYDKFIKKGTFQFGTISYYQQTENLNIKDGYEGFSNLYLRINGFHVAVSAFTGYNYLIFCGTSKEDSDSLKNQFGEVQLTIPNVSSFCTAVKSAIGARSFSIKRVHYDNFKIYETDLLKVPNFNPSNLFGPEMVRLMRDNSLLPSLFVKPERYAQESEVRIVFEMERDMKKPLRISNVGLLDHIKVKYI